MSQEMTEKLFNEFPSVTTEEWKEKIINDLKGADYDKKLVWKTIEGINVQPFYRAEDIENLPHMGTNPGEYPYVRGKKADNNNWDIRQDIDLVDPVEANKAALESIQRGANAIGFKVKDITSADQMAALLKDIDPTVTKIHFVSSRSYKESLQLFIAELDNRKINTADVAGSINFDPFSYALLHGEFYGSLENNIEEAKEIITLVKERLPQFKAIAVNGAYLQDAAANISMELGFSLAAANEYVYQLIEKGMSVDTVAPMIQFNMGIGSNYFFEIAKLRAARMLWAKIVEQYQPAAEDSMKMNIHSTTSMWNKSIFDPNVNMLRTTTEAMSAALGGCDSMNVQPYDATYKTSDTFSRRVARNTQIILKEESYFDKIVDPAAGSYYIETITDAIAEQAWKLFTQVEEKGGYTAAIKAGFVQENIEEMAKNRDMLIATRREILLGTNQFPNAAERMGEKIQLPQEAEKMGTDFKAIKPYRGAMAFEELRLKTEKHIQEGNDTPKVFLLTMGNLAMRKARAGFASNFFGCAGFEVIDNNGFATVEEGVEAAINAKSNIVVICSSDEEYAEIAAPIAQQLKEKAPATAVVIAGNPVEIKDQLEAAGVTEFINVRTNLLESLRAFQANIIK